MVFASFKPCSVLQSEENLKADQGKIVEQLEYLSIKEPQKNCCRSVETDGV